MISIPRKSRLNRSRGPDPQPAASGAAERWRALALAGAAKLVGVAVALGAALASRGGFAPALPLPALALTAGATAAAAGALFGLPRWWRVIHLALPLLVWGALVAGPDPAWYLAAFVASVLVFGAAPGGAVPLYLSSAAEIQALSTLIPAGAPVRVLDAGCGTGTVLAGLRLRRPDARLEGIECSVLPWLAARVRMAGRGCRVQWGSLWRADFGGYDVVYAFLSPAPMARLWNKARREMRPGSLLVSNRFPVPGTAPSFAVSAGPRGRLLYVWRM
jgi:hypothetical protein